MDAILSAPDHLVRATLIALCSDGAQLSKAKHYLDKMGNAAPSPVAPLADDKTLKRKATDEIKICVQCQEPFYEVDNEGKTPCKFHNGDLEQDRESAVWDDWDEPCHGVQDCEESREEYPQGFVWSCCGKKGTHPGCARDQHKAVDATRGRYSPTSDSDTYDSPDNWSNKGEEDEGEEDEE